MKALLILFFSIITFSLNADTYVGGYHRSDGSYVEPHMRSDANETPLDNWSTKGNVNPYTGEEGTRNINPYEDVYQRQMQEENEFNSMEGSDIWD